jgi:hypothetical protein
MADRISESNNHTARHGSRFYEFIEIIEAVALAVIAVATAWSGYQSALWSSRQSEFYGESSKLRVSADTDATWRVNSASTML